MNRASHRKARCWLAEPLPPEAAAAIEALARLDDVERIAVMPDAHLAKQVCVGLVVGMRSRIFPAAVGGDIGCGILTARFSGAAELLADERLAAKLLDALYRRVPSLKHGAGTMPEALPEALAHMPLSHPRLDKLKSREGRVQLGTLGRGNHFLEFQSDDQDQLWVMIHSGLRGMGQAITNHHLAGPDRSRGQVAAVFRRRKPRGM